MCVFYVHHALFAGRPKQTEREYCTSSRATTYVNVNNIIVCEIGAKVAQKRRRARYAMLTRCRWPVQKLRLKLDRFLFIWLCTKCIEWLARFFFNWDSTDNEQHEWFLAAAHLSCNARTRFISRVRSNHFVPSHERHFCAFYLRFCVACCT